MPNKDIINLVLIVILVAGGSFYGGMRYQQQKQPRNSNPQFSQNGPDRGVGQRQGNAGGMMRQAGINTVRGQILSQDGNSITVKLPDESTKIVVVSDGTTINKAIMGTKDDLKTGEQVMVFGKTNSDGSVSATQIQLNPTTRGGPGQSDQPNQPKQQQTPPQQ